MSLSRGGSEDGGLTATIAEKDAEISSLRAQLEDKERMIAALTSARRKNEAAQELGSDGSPASRRTSQQRSEGINGSVLPKGSPATSSPRTFSLSSNSERRMDDVTRMLDEMILKQVDSAERIRRSSLPGNASASSGTRRSSLRPVNESLVSETM
jgi:centromeric protein E